MQRARSRQRVPEYALPTNLQGVCALPPPPEGFNPLAANNATLIKFGIHRGRIPTGTRMH